MVKKPTKKIGAKASKTKNTKTTAKTKPAVSEIKSKPKATKKAVTKTKTKVTKTKAPAKTTTSVKSSKKAAKKATTTTTTTTTTVVKTTVPRAPSPQQNNASTPAAVSSSMTATKKTEFNGLNEVVALRMQREGVNSGELHVTLIWNDIADLDIHAITPTNEHIYYGHKEGQCGGWLDVDMNRSSENVTLEPIENIFWAKSPSGKYKFYVHNFCNRTDPKTVFTDSQRKVPFRVRLKRGDYIEWFEGSVGPGENLTCFEFNHQGSGAVGSFIVLPPHHSDSTFKELCQLNGVDFKMGSGYYSVKKKEHISKKKDMLLHKESNDTFVIDPAECRRILGIAPDTDVDLKPTDIPSGYRLFVQSTSHNRKIPKDTHTLYKVSVKEALQFRMKDKYTFK